MRARNAVRWGLLAIGLIAAAAMVGCSTSGQAASLDSKHLLSRKDAVEQLAKKEDMAKYDDLVVVLREDPERLVRSEAAFSLGRLGQTYYSVGFYPLVDALENDSSAFVRAAAALSLSYTRDSRAIAPLVRALGDTGRGEMAVKDGDKVTVYKACVADAARESLERILEMKIASSEDTTEAQRTEIARTWQQWYASKAHMLPSETALASR
jgi:HEAT repeat protein